MVQGTLYCCDDSVRSHIIRIAAAYGKSTLKLVSKAPEFEYGKTNKTPDFTKKFFAGRVPAFEDGRVHLFDSNAIATYVASEQLRGGASQDATHAEVIGWMHIAETELLPAVCTWTYPALSLMQPDKERIERAKTELSETLKSLNEYLATRTFLVGERITLADVAVACNLLLAFQTVFDATYRARIVNVTRWFETCIHQREFHDVVGDIKLCATVSEFDAHKFEAVKKHAAAASAHHGGHEAAAHGGSAKKAGGDEKKKQDGGSAKKGGDDHKKKEEPQKKKEEPKKEAAKKKDEEEDDDAPKEDEKDPFAAMPKGNFKMEEFKRVITNKDADKEALPYFWEHFEAANYSLWYCDYKFPQELRKVFMTCNLINGFFQRIEKMYKQSYGVMGVFGEDGNNTISGVWFWCGQSLAFELAEDWKLDYDSYEWKKLDPADPATRELVNGYFKHADGYARPDGKKINAVKIFR